MPVNSKCQLLIDPPADCAWNMAVDEALLSATAELGQPTLRFYEWQRPALSLGYFQKYAERDTHLASQNASVVRRLSGGGAILHDHELTYSLFLPASHRLAQETQVLYSLVHETIVTVLNALLASSGWQAELCQQPSGLAASDEPFLCFERRTAGDILLLCQASLDTPKIVGSAQRRRRGVVLQHGSILLEQSPAAPELLGIAEITKLRITPAELIPGLLQGFAQKLGLELQTVELSNQLTANALQLQNKKYETSSWLKRR